MRLYKSILVLFLLVLASLVKAQSLTQLWQSDTLFRVPESVLLDTKNNVLYVSNIDGKPAEQDGKGFISKLNPNGKIVAIEWVTGLDAPKGMGLFNNKLYVADLTKVVIIDIATGSISKSITIEGAQFLNDITVDAAGNVYVSDSATGIIHQLTNDNPTVFFQHTDFKRINGLLAQKNGLYIADFANGAFYLLSWNKKSFTKLSDVAPTGNDGIVKTGKNEFIISCWPGEVYFVDPQGKSTKMLDTKEQKINSADTEYNAKTSTLYVPTFFNNRVVAYTFKR